jgi:hypothetical protein
MSNYSKLLMFPFGTSSRIVRGDQPHQLSPWHHQVHLIEELPLARPLGLELESGRTKAHLFHADTVSYPMIFARGYADHL